MKDLFGTGLKKDKLRDGEGTALHLEGPDDPIEGTGGLDDGDTGTIVTVDADLAFNTGLVLDVIENSPEAIDVVVDLTIAFDGFNGGGFGRLIKEDPLVFVIVVPFATRPSAFDEVAQRKIHEDD